jgi:hypothetical protein
VGKGLQGFLLHVLPTFDGSMDLDTIRILGYGYMGTLIPVSKKIIQMLKTVIRHFLYEFKASRLKCTYTAEK